MNATWMLSLLALLVAGCVPSIEPYPPDAALERWQGRPIERVVSSWGAPFEVTAVEDGQLYRWPASAYPPSSLAVNLAPGRTHAYRDDEAFRCRAELKADTDGVVKSAVWKGYECYVVH